MTVAEHFVGRAEELGSLERLLDDWIEAIRTRSSWRANRGSARPGSSGSWPLALGPEGTRSSPGSASELERELPFPVFVDALDEYVEGLDPEQLATLDDDVQAELAYVFRRCLRSDGDERWRSSRSATAPNVRCALLEQLAGPRPLLLVLDDHQWADSASVELLDALLSKDARLVLEGAAVAGDPFEPELGVMYAQHRDDRRADRLGELVGLPPHGRPGRIASRATG